jgi:hypothetical protein
MDEEFFDIAIINFDKYVLHGRIVDAENPWDDETFDYRVRNEKYIEQVLTDDQKRLVWELEDRHRDERNKLLSSFIVRD